MDWWLLTALVSGVVGILIGWSGIAGFLLPLFYADVVGLSIPTAMTFSFTAFFISGLLGAAAYRKRGLLPLKTTIPLFLGSLAGAVPGVILNRFIATGSVKQILYVVVLLSGISILIRERQKTKTSDVISQPTVKPAVLVALGFSTGALCALSGAGGPILVMPLLVLLGFDVKSSIGIALLDSVFIALPSIIGYGLKSDLSSVWPLFLIGGAAHGFGVLVGSKTSSIIKQRPLKITVAVLSIAIAVYMLIGAWT